MNNTEKYTKLLEKYFNYSEMRVEFLNNLRDNITSNNEKIEKSLLKFWNNPSSDYQFQGCIIFFEKLNNKMQEKVMKRFKEYIKDDIDYIKDEDLLKFIKE